MISTSVQCTPYAPRDEILGAGADGVPVLLVERELPAPYLLEQPGLVAVKPIDVIIAVR